MGLKGSQPRRDWRDARRKLRWERRCRNCRSLNGLQLAHTVGRKAQDSLSRVDDYDLYVAPDSVIPLCSSCHRTYDARALSILRLLTLDEQLDAVRAAEGIELARDRLDPPGVRVDT